MGVYQHLWILVKGIAKLTLGYLIVGELVCDGLHHTDLLP